MRPASKNSAWLAKLREEKGIVTKALDEKPDLFADVVWLWNAFQTLSQRRSYSFGGPHPISIEAMDAYLRMKGIHKEDELDLFLFIIPKMDDVWLEDYSKRQEQEQKIKDQKAKRK